MDKLVVEVIKVKKGLDSLYGIRGILVTDCFNLIKVDFNSIYAYNKPKILYIFYSKFVFLNINL